MATDGSIGRQRAAEIERIERACSALSGGKPLVLPTFNRHGTDMLLIQQLRAIADHLEAAGVASPAASPNKSRSHEATEKAKHD